MNMKDIFKILKKKLNKMILKYSKDKLKFMKKIYLFTNINIIK